MAAVWRANCTRRARPQRFPVAPLRPALVTLAHPTMRSHSIGCVYEASPASDTLIGKSQRETPVPEPRSCAGGNVTSLPVHPRSPQPHMPRVLCVFLLFDIMLLPRCGEPLPLHRFGSKSLRNRRPGYVGGGRRSSLLLHENHCPPPMATHG